MGGIEHEVSRIQFDSTGNSFWIDDFTISQAQVSSKCIQLLEYYSAVQNNISERGRGETSADTV